MVSTNEPVVPLSSRPPPGYRLVPKGNPYITLNCRKQTHASGQKVYQVVKGPNRSPVGIRVPTSIYDTVLAQFHATKEDRANAVHKRDDKLEDKYRDAVLKAFPRVQKDIVGRIVKHAMAKKSGRVGRTGTLSIEEKAVLGTMAHIRHVHTSYDTLLRSGVSKQRARKETYEQIMKKAQEWGFRSSEGGHYAPGKERRGKTETRRQTKKEKRRARRRESSDERDPAHSRPICAKGQNSAPIEISDDSDDHGGLQMALPLRSKPAQNVPVHHEGSQGSAGHQRRVPSATSAPRAGRRGFATTRSMAKARGQDVDRIYRTSLQSFDDDDDIGKGDGGGLSDSDDVCWISSDENTDDADNSYGEEEED